MKKDRIGRGSIRARAAILLVSMAGSPDQALIDRLQLVEIAWAAGPGNVWLSGGTLPAVSAALAEAFSTGQVWSAVLLGELPSADRRWITVEWRGKLLVERTLRELVPPGDWVDAGEYHDLVILQPGASDPQGPQPPQTVETAAEFRDVIYGPPVIVDVSVREVLGDLSGWFGDLADERIGGAFALLTMSGASSQPTVRLRNPAALGLRFDDNPESLGAHRRAGRIRATGFGHSRHALGSAADVARRFQPGSGYRRIQEELDRRPLVAAAYVVVLELSATVDPVVLIPQGAVFEQEGLTGAQTLAAAENRTSEVDVSAFVPVVLSAWCLDSNLSAPTGQPVRPTPFVFPVSGYPTQSDIWQRRDEFIGGPR